MIAAKQSPVFAQARSGHFVFPPVRGRRRAKTFELVPESGAGISMGMKALEHARTVIMDEAALLGWFETASRGDRCTYHVGHLAADRARDTSYLAGAAREMLGRVADRVMALVTDSRLIAVQQRLADGRTAYLAIKTGPRSARFAASHPSRGG